MKRIGNLYHHICTMDNLVAAEKKARRGKRGQYGIDIFDRDPQANLEQLHYLLTSGEYRTSVYKTEIIYEPKEREIFKLPYFPDRIAHHAIMNILEPVFKACFTADTYSGIKGRGIHAALFKLENALKNDEAGTQYCLKIDIRKFYPNIDHVILKKQLYRKLKEQQLLSLLFGIVDSAPGMPIGNLPSQYFANFYLTPFDHWIKERMGVKHYYRYCDDIIILAGDKPYLHKLLAAIHEYMQVNLKLELKNNYQVFPVESRGIDALGYVTRHSHTRLRPSIKKRMARMIERNRNNASLAAYKGWTKHCSSRHLMKKLLADV